MSGIYVMTDARRACVTRLADASRTKAKASMQQIVELMCQGHPDKTIARRLGIAITTIKHKRAAFMQRHQIKGRTQLGVWAERKGWAPV